MGPNYRLLALGTVALLVGMGGFQLAKTGFLFLGTSLGLGSIGVIFFVVIKGQIEFLSSLKNRKDCDR